MEENEFENLYKAITGLTNDNGAPKFDIGDFDTFYGKMQTPEDRKGFYDSMANAGFDLGDYDQYEARLSVPDVKKKDDGQLDSTLVPASVVPSSVPIIGSITSEEEPESQEPEFWTGEFGWLENTFFGDAISDVALQIQSGQAAGQSSSEALDLLLMGSNVSDEDLDEFMSQYGLSQSYGTTDEMIEFQQDAEEMGGGFFGTLLAGVKNPMASVQMMASSMAQLGNEKALSVGGTVIAGTTAAGSLIPGVGNAAAFGVAMPMAMGAAGGITETGMVFQELLIEELEKRGQEFSRENLRNILNDDEWFAKAKMTAIKKGGTTAVIDMVGGALTAGAGSTFTRGGRGVYKASQELIEKGVDVVDAIPVSAPSALRRVKGVGVAAAGEGTTGGLSEVGGQLAAYGEVRGGEVAEEIIGGLGKTPISVASAVLQGARYKVNGKKVSRSELTDVMHGMSMTEIYRAIDEKQIEIDGDEGLLDLLYGSPDTRISFDEAVKNQTESSRAYKAALDELDKAIESRDLSAIDEAKAKANAAKERADADSDIVRVEGYKIADSRNRKVPRISIREEDDPPKPEDKLDDEPPKPKPEEPVTPSETELKLNEAKAKLDALTNTESAAAERRTKTLEESGRLEDAQDLQERINALQNKLDGGLTKKGKPFSKKGKEGLQKQIDNRTEELKALYADVGIEEDVATVLSSSRERARAQSEVDDLQEQFDTETKENQRQKKIDDRSDALSDLEQQRNKLQTELKEMKAERKKLGAGGMGDSPQAQQLNKDIDAAEREVGDLSVKIQQSKQAQKTKDKDSVKAQLKRYGLDGDLQKPAKQTVVNGTKVNVDTGEQTYFKGFQVGSLINHPIVLQGFGGQGKNAFDGEMRGFLRVRENGLVVFVTNDGRKNYELGNINKGFDLDSFSTDSFMAMDNSPIPAITDGGQVVVNGKAYRLARDQAGFGITRYKNNNIKDMVVLDDEGKEFVLIENGRLKSNNKSAKGFSEEMALWAEQQNEKKKGNVKSPEIFSEEGTDQEGDTDVAPPDEPPTPPEDTDTDQQPPEPEGEPTPTLDPEEREKRLEQEGVFGSTWMSRHLPMIDRVRRNTLSSRGFFPKSVQALRDFRDGRLNLHARKAEKTAKDFMKVWKKMSKSMTEDEQQQVMRSMDLLLRGEQVNLTASGIPAEMVLVIGRMRRHIDSMSQDMLDRGLIPDKNKVDPDTGERVSSRENIENNIGSYVSRTYELFEGKDWASRVNRETKDSAIQYFKERVANDESLNKQFKEWADKQVEKDPEKLLQDFAAKQVENILLKDADSVKQFGPQDAPNRSPLLQRQDLDPRLRALFGERTNPMTNYIVTAARLGQLAEKARYLAEVREMGLNMGWLSEGTTDVGVEGYEASLEIDGVPDELNPLSGMRTHPDIAKAFQEQPNWFDRNIAGNTLGKIFGIAKWNKTVGSATTHARNVIGNTSFVVANGHLDAKAGGTALSEIFRPTEQGYNRLVELGVIGQASNRQEITELMNSGTVLDALEQRFSKKGSPFQEFGKKAYDNTLGKAANVADKMYLAEDDFFKIYGFEIEKNRYAKALYGTDFNALSDQQKQAVEERSAAIIKDVYPNYSRIGPLIAGISKMPVVGTFLAFRAESFRVSFNIMRLAIEEMQDPATRNIGAKRMAGVGSYLGGKAAIQSSSAAGAGYGLMGALGMGKNEEEDEAQKEGKHKSDFDDLAYFVRPWEKYGYNFRELGYKENVISDQLVVTDIDRENGVVKYRNMSTVDGFSDPTSVIQRMMAGLQGKGEISDNRLVDAFAGGLVELVGPFVEEEMTTGMLNQFTNNQTANGAPIWNPDDDREKILSDVYEHFFKLMPSVFEQSKKLAEGGYGETTGEAFLGVIGLGELTVDVREQMQRGVIPMFAEQLERNNKMRWKPEEYEGGESVQDYLAVTTEKTERDKQVMNDLIDYTQAAMNLGVKEYLIREDLERLKFPSKIYLNGSLEPAAFNAVDLILSGNKNIIAQITPNLDRDYKGPQPE